MEAYGGVLKNWWEVDQRGSEVWVTIEWRRYVGLYDGSVPKVWSKKNNAKTLDNIEYRI